MENQWAIPPTDLQRRQRIPPTVERLGPAFQPNMPEYQQGEDATTQNCSCSQCSEAQRAHQALPTTWYAVEQQDPRHFGNVDPLYLNQYQNDDDRFETAIIVPDRARAPQNAWIQDNYTPVQERAGRPDMGLGHAMSRDASIAESRRV